MAMRDQQREYDEQDDEALDTAESGVEFDERRAKMERLRSEGIEPYPRRGFPDRDKSPVPLHHQRLLAMAESINQLLPGIPE